MQLVITLDNSTRWVWQFQNEDGSIIAVSAASFPSYAVAIADAREICRHVADAPIEFASGPPRVRQSSRKHELPAQREIQARLKAFRALLEVEGLIVALQFLNRSILHRYTALYRLAGNVLESLVLIDKLDAILPSNLAVVPYSQSFCQFAIRDGLFRTENSAWDPRLDGHPAQGFINSYHGFPLVAADGSVLGTICHFDEAALALDDESFELLRLVAQILVDYLPNTGADFAPKSTSSG